MPELDLLDFFGGRLKLRHLVVALTVAEQGSAVAAAQALYVSQPAVTRLVAELESVLGVPMFVRTAHGMVPTPYAHTFLDHARSALSQLRVGARHVSEERDGHTGTVRVGVHLAGVGPLTRAVISLKRYRPRIQITVEEERPDVLRTRLMRGELDLAVSRVSTMEPRRPEDVSELTVVELTDEPIWVMAAPDHPVLDESDVTLGDLAGLSWVVPHVGTSLRQELHAAFDAAAMQFPVDVVESTTLSVMHTLVATGGFVAVMPRGAAEAIPGLVRVPVRGWEVDRRIGVAWRRDQGPGPAARLLVGHLYRACGLACDEPGR